MVRGGLFADDTADHWRRKHDVDRTAGDGGHARRVANRPDNGADEIGDAAGWIAAFGEAKAGSSEGRLIVRDRGRTAQGQHPGRGIVGAGDAALIDETQNIASDEAANADQGARQLA